jgi:DNA-binding NarL/FixJ family response regulator
MDLRVLLVDDNQAFIAAAVRLLEAQGLTVAGTASTAEAAVELTARLRPEVVLVDIKLGSESGIDLAHHLSGGPGFEEPRVVLISTHAEEDFRDLIEASPAVGFVAKSALSADAVRAALGDQAG